MPFGLPFRVRLRPQEPRHKSDQKHRNYAIADLLGTRNESRDGHKRGDPDDADRQPESIEFELVSSLPVHGMNVSEVSENENAVRL